MGEEQYTEEELGTLQLQFEPAPRMSGRTRIAAAAIVGAGIAAGAVIVGTIAWVLVNLLPFVAISWMFVGSK